ncbi:hypothetical protein, partial [Histophilus somni]|uniref:hypothetical protein n=1 Tax=Histophilus somni TaxID=731 RepID=UPI00201EBC37
VSIPENATKFQISIYKNPGKDLAFFDDIFVYSLEGPVEGYPKPDGEPVEHVKLNSEPEDKPTEPEDKPTESEKEENIELNVNLVKNPNFDLGYDNKGKKEKAEIEGWPNDLDKDISEDNLGQTKITPSGYQGSNSIVTGPGEGGRSQYILNVPENMKFVLKVVGKVSHANDPGYFGVDALDKDMKKLPGGKFGGQFRETEWTNRSLEFTTIPGTKALQIYTYKNPAPEGQDSYAFYDNFELIALGKDESNTPAEEILQNPGFEEGLVGWNYWENMADHTIINEPVVKGKNAILINGDDGIGQQIKLE